MIVRRDPGIDRVSLSALTPWYYKYKFTTFWPIDICFTMERKKQGKLY